MQTGGVRGERGLGDAATGNWQEDNSLGCPRSHAHESQRLHDATNSSYKSRYRTIRRRSVHSATSDRPQPQAASTTALDIPCRSRRTAHQATPTRMCPPPDNASRSITKQSNPGIVHRERVNRTAHATASASAGCARNHYCQTQCVAVTTRQLPPRAEAQRPLHPSHAHTDSNTAGAHRRRGADPQRAGSCTHLQRQQQQERLHTVEATVNEVAQEQVVRIRALATDAEQLQQIVKLAVDVAADLQRHNNADQGQRASSRGGSRVAHSTKPSKKKLTPAVPRKTPTQTHHHSSLPGSTHDREMQHGTTVFAAPAGNETLPLPTMQRAAGETTLFLARHERRQRARGVRTHAPSRRTARQP